MVSISHRLRRSPSCFFACTLPQMRGCLLRLLPESSAAPARFLPGSQGAVFAPLLHLGLAGGKLVKPWLVHYQIQRAFRRGSFAADYSGATLCTGLCVYIHINSWKVWEMQLQGRGRCCRAADPWGWGRRRHALPPSVTGRLRSNSMSGTTCVKRRRVLGGPHRLSHTDALHLLPHPAIPWFAPPSLGLHSQSLPLVPVLTPGMNQNSVTNKRWAATTLAIQQEWPKYLDLRGYSRGEFSRMKGWEINKKS